jgi:hypothetical protein
MIDTTTRNVALLIDADNASAATLDPVLTVLAELGTVNVRRVYGNWSKPALKTKGKNATDMKMTIDAMDLLFRGRIDGFGIMSSDSDFMPLATRIRQDGIPVYGFGTSRTPEGFRQACTRFIDVGALNETSQAMPTPAPAPVAGEKPATPAPVARPKTAQPIDEQVIKLLIDAYNAVKRDEKGYASVAELGQLAGNRSSFDARNYGFNRLSDLIETIPNFQHERREGGRSFVKRLR